MRGVFVTGTDTEIGKTLVSAWLVKAWAAEYWKPVQTGAADTADFDTVAQLVPDATIHPSAYVLQAPLSPHEAARRERVRIDLSAFTLPAAARPLVVEGAGGAMVPLNELALTVDLMERLRLPALVVARSGLGTINHTLMTLEVLRRRRIPILGVVMNGQRNPANRRAIEHYGAVPVLAELQPLPAVTASVVAGLPPPAFDPPEVG
ncbi:dethiobiotin synthase [Magnetospirillum sp. UT-4]|uniref:dethiobiotin synthase n=1 Tax=Magnetospirillum sp. UT-4 TaxID=2681467 RepID=UPI00137CA0F1|nr:dethiobiotin synthase [Magnetospirillum sp. UT-4]CAA7626514.1 ATP-dependent dethiobiotin synthetase BioD [Magnetospirillum sp. UT-4]